MTPEQRDRLNALWPLCQVGNVLWPKHDFDLHGTCRRCQNTTKKMAYNHKKSEQKPAEGSRK